MEQDTDQITGQRDSFTWALALSGTLLVWFPLLAPFLFSLLALIAGGGLRFDFLMPAELFLVVVAGGALLVWAAGRAQARRRLTGWALALAVLALLASQGLAVVTGLASGDTEVGGWQWTLVLALLLAYILAVAAMGVAGILLLRDLKQPGDAPHTS